MLKLETIYRLQRMLFSRLSRLQRFCNSFLLFYSRDMLHRRFLVSIFERIKCKVIRSLLTKPASPCVASI